jgi:uncharacterized membrane protein YbaN (DUF454 family)
MTIMTGSVKARRVLFAALGVLCLALGIIGVFVPGLPTTEFVLAASYLFSRSSPALEGWLERNRWFGTLLRRFKETRGMSREAKVLALAWTWTGIGISVYMLAARGVGVQLLLVALGLIGTVTILFFGRYAARNANVVPVAR